MTTTLKELPIESVKPDPDQPRSGKLDVADLMKSIAEIGLIEPIVVRPIGDVYVVVAGHRRLEAMKKLGDWKTISALVVTDYNEMGAFRDALAENTVRQPLSAKDEANAMVKLSGMGMTDAEIAATFARDAQTVAAAKSLAEVSEKGAKALKEVKTAEGVQLTIEQADAVARFGGLSSGRTMMMEIQNGSRYWRHSYESLLRKEKIDADAKEITKAHKGVKKVPSFNSWEGPEKTVEPLVNLTDVAGKALTTTGHKACPGHAYSVERPSTMYGTTATKCTVAYWCTDWKANKHKVSKEPKRKWSQRGKTQTQTRGAKGPSKEVIAEETALDAAWDEATARRRVFIEEFLSKPKSGEKWTYLALVMAVQGRIDLDDDDIGKMNLKQLVTAVIEDNVTENERMLADWRWGTWQKDAKIEFLNFLVEQGHELSDAEKTVIQRANDGVTAQTRRDEFVAPDSDEAADAYDDEVEVGDDEDDFEV